MKQMIVLVSSIILGIAIATLVMNFKVDAANLSETAKDAIATISGITI